jgi:photosystem II reaction center protein Psb28
MKQFQPHEFSMIQLVKNWKFFDSEIYLTKSKNGETGTATFLIFLSESFFEDYIEKTPIQHVFLFWKNKKFTTTEVFIHFLNGQPYIFECVFFLFSPNEWDIFFDFLNSFSKQIHMEYSVKDYL